MNDAWAEWKAQAGESRWRRWTNGLVLGMAARGEEGQLQFQAVVGAATSV